MDTLGAPIGARNTVPSDSFDQGEHGAGIGLSGGASAPNAQNSIVGGLKDDDFNAGLGGQHASAGLPSSGTHPIADKYMSSDSSEFADTTGSGNYGGSGLSGSKLDNPLDNYSGNAGGAGAGGDGYGGSYAKDTAGGYGGSGAVSGAYEGGATSDALGGQSAAFETNPGVGYGGENLQSSSGYDQSAGIVGASGGAGGHYPETAGRDGPGVLGGQTGSGLPGGADGAGAYAAPSDYGSSGQKDSGNDDNSGGNKISGNASGAQGHYGTTDDDPSRGAPVANPEDLDTGGRHSLVFDQATGEYKHRHELEGGSR